MDRAASRETAGVALSVRTGCAGQGSGGRGARLGDRVRVSDAEVEGSGVAAGGFQGIRADGRLLDQLREDGKSEWEGPAGMAGVQQSEEHTSELQSRFGISYAVF